MSQSPDLEPFWLKHTVPARQQTLGRRRIPLVVSRVAQLDADLLDEELHHVLAEPLYQSLQLFKSSRNSQDYQAVLSTLIRYAFLRTSLLRYGASYGASLQNLWYSVLGKAESAQRTSLTRTQIELYSVLAVFPRYLLDRLRDYMLSRGWSDYPEPSNYAQLLVPEQLRRNATLREANKRQRERKRLAWNLLQATEQAWSILSLANFIAFLSKGKFRSLIDRIFNTRLVYRHESFARAVSFEFLNRQLVWEAFTEFLLFILPLVNLRKMRLRLSRLLMASKLVQWLVALPHKLLARSDSGTKITANAQQESLESAKPSGELAHLAADICPICYSFSELPGAHIAEPGDPTDPTMGVMVGFSNVADSSGRSAATEVKTAYSVDCCGGLYCYYCITSKLVVWDEDRAGLDGGWPCLRCGQQVFSATRATDEQLGIASRDADKLVT